MKCICFCDKFDSWLSVFLSFVSFVVEQPILSNFSDKSIPRVHFCVWSTDKTNSVHLTVFLMFPCTFSLILFSLLSNFLHFSHLLSSSDDEHPSSSCVGSDTVVLQVYYVTVTISHLRLFCFLVLPRGSLKSAALFTGFLFHPCSTDLTTSLIVRLHWLFTHYCATQFNQFNHLRWKYFKCKRHKIYFYTKQWQIFFILYVHSC